MSLLSRLFGRSEKPAKADTPKPVIYHDFQIIAEPIKEGARYRVAARIEKTIDGTVKRHQLIRADTLENWDEAVQASIGKAKTMIDQQGDQIF